MGDGDKGARLSRSLRQPLRALVRFSVGKIEWQPGCNDVPVFAGGGRHGVNFGANQGCEIAGAQLAGVGDRPIEAVQEMIEWAWRFPRQKWPGVEKGRIRIISQVVCVSGLGQANLTETCWFFVNSNKKISLIKFVGKCGEERRLFRNLRS